MVACRAWNEMLVRLFVASKRDEDSEDEEESGGKATGGPVGPGGSPASSAACQPSRSAH